MGSRSRNKGKAGEREFARLLRSEGFDAHRGVQYHGGPESPDVVGLPGIHIEVKRTEKLRLYDALAQSISDSGESEMPVVAHRRNNCGWVIVQPARDWLKLYREHEEANDEQ